MQWREHKRKRGRPPKKGEKLEKRRSLVITVTLPEEIGTIIEDIVKTTRCSASHACLVAITRGLQGRKATSPEQLVADIAQAHARLVREREVGRAEGIGEPLIRPGEGLGDALRRHRKTLA